MAVFFRSESLAVPSVYSNEDSYVKAIGRFGTELECFVNTCLGKNQTVRWFKNNRPISQNLNVTSSTARIRHKVYFDPTKDCSGNCFGASRDCPKGQRCLNSACCTCEKEEFTLLLWNLTYEDTGIYRCQLDGGNSVELDLEIVENGLFPANSNLTFNYAECCRKENVSESCLPLCQPSRIEMHKFDPVACEHEYGKMLRCVTEAGNVSHEHCCRSHLVPQFCWEFCTGRLTELKRSHQFCTYWMHEIFDCYESNYLPFPGPPENLVVNMLNSSAVKACWSPPKVRPETVDYYTVRYQELPDFPLIPIFREFENDLLGTGPMSRKLPGTFGPPDVDPPEIVRMRSERQSIFIKLQDLQTNKTDIREYKLNELKTNKTCAVVSGLKPGTQFMFHVTATNSYGTSLATLKETVETAPIRYENSTMPDVYGCCKDNGVSSKCLPKLCDLNKLPSSFDAFGITFTCKSEFALVAPCLADGRNHSACCAQKGVAGDCLRLCDGSVSNLGLGSILCLSLDMKAIYSCLKEGYVTHPSPPQNVSVKFISFDSAMISWSPPDTNAERVASYSLFYKKGKDDQYKEVKNVTSPYELRGLKKNVAVSVYLVAHTPEGSSLKSTRIEIVSRDEGSITCKVGVPLLTTNGEPLMCYREIDCPLFYACTGNDPSGDFPGHCCPTEQFVREDMRPSAPDLAKCCAEKGVTGKCLNLCSYNTTTQDLVVYGSACFDSIKVWVECGGDSRDHRPCCADAGVPTRCLDFCHSPITDINSDHLACIKHASTIATCVLHGVLKLPGPARNLHVVAQGTNFVNLSWSEPSQTTKVDFYEVVLQDNVRTVYKENTTELYHYVSPLEPDIEYKASLISYNQFGTSTPSGHLTFVLHPAYEGRDMDRPSAPYGITVAWVNTTAANITWKWSGMTVNSKPCQNFKFRVFNRLASLSSWDKVEATTTHLVWKNLQPAKLYNLYVVAVDLTFNMSSSPSEVISFTSPERSFSPQIDLQVEGGKQLGDKVTITCFTVGNGPLNLTLEFGGKRVATGVDRIWFVTEHVTSYDNFKPMVCSGKGASGKAVKIRRYLQIVFPPVVSIKSKPITVYSDFDVVLPCEVRAFPVCNEFNIHWLFTPLGEPRAKSVEPDFWHAIIVDIDRPADVPPSTSQSSLTISKVGEKDSGTYTCTACNELGCGNSSVELTVQPFVIPNGPESLLACCKKQNLLAECQSACTVDIDVNLYLHKPHCLNEFPKLLKCAKDGVDHRQCCIYSGVPSSCLGYCDRDGDAPLNLYCLNFTSQILTCVQELHVSLPSAPLDIAIRQVPGSSAVNVTWKPPLRNGKLVEVYIIYYKPTYLKNYLKFRTEKNWAVLSDLNASATYEVTVTAVNQNGFSNFPPTVTYQMSAVAAQTAESSGGSAAYGTIIVILVAIVLGVTVLYFCRKPYRLPAMIFKGRERRGANVDAGSVAFENPGYEQEGQVRVLTPDGDSRNARRDVDSYGWERPELQSVNESEHEQEGMRYTRFS